MSLTVVCNRTCQSGIKLAGSVPRTAENANGGVVNLIASFVEHRDNIVAVSIAPVGNDVFNGIALAPCTHTVNIDERIFFFNRKSRNGCGND